MPSKDHLCKECLYFFYDVLGTPICTFGPKSTWPYCPACPKFKSDMSL